MLNFLATMLLLFALVVLAAALWPIGRLLAQLPSGSLRTQWRALAVLVFFFIAGYWVYLATFHQRAQSLQDLLVPALFLGCACFVWFGTRSSLATVLNLRHLSSPDRTQVTDVLTGLHSRNYLDAPMRQEMQRVKRHGLAVSVLLLDIDHFADVNQNYGHAVGDQVLTEIGRILGASLRGSDLLVRYGGEEMAVLATHTPPAAAMVVAERLRRDIEIGARKALRAAQGARHAITVSIGVAGREAGAQGADDLFAMAEQALQTAKKQGRNRVALSGS
jgi:diguanylate cyclase (GGDEF)-like protein